MINTFNEYLDKVSNAELRLQDYKNTVIPVGGRSSTFWYRVPDAGTYGAQVYDRTTPGAIPLPQSSEDWFLSQVVINTSIGSTIMIVDRLVGGSNYTGNVGETQTANTPALTRYTDGIGVFIGIDMQLAASGSVVDLTVNYNDENGNPQNSIPIQLGGTGFNTVNRVLIPTHNSKGVTKINSVTLSAAPIAVMDLHPYLFKPLIMLPSYLLGSEYFLYDGIIGNNCNLPLIDSEACLEYHIIGTATTSLLATTRFIRNV